MVFGRQVCRGAGNRAAQCSGAGGVLPSQRSLSRTDIHLASRLPFGQRKCRRAGPRAAPSVEGRQEAHPATREGIAAQGEGAGGSGCAADSEKKSPGDLGRQRGRLINVPDRLLCVSLIREAAQSGCRLEKACNELGLSLRTFQRWVGSGDAVLADGRTTTERPSPSHKLSEAEPERMLEVADRAELANLPPSQIVPGLADRGGYLASESSFYRVLRSASQQHHRGRARKPSARVVSSHCATGPNQVWSWDITWMPAAVKGQYYYWYMMLDVFSRRIVAHEVHEAESAELAWLLIRRGRLAEGLPGRPLVLHSDNGSPMKGATMLATLENLGVVASFSRPRVSNDNPYAESLFRTCKYRPDYPRRPFGDVDEARARTQQFVRWD